MSTTKPRLSLIALSEGLLPTPEGVATQLAERYPGAAAFASTSQSGASVTFSFGEATGNYTLIDKPIPWEHIEGPCTLAWYWPDAVEVMRSHQQHLLITLLDEVKDPIERAIRHTQLTSALAATSPSVGLVWGPSGAVHRPVDFTVQAAQMPRDDLPLHLWVDFRVSQRDDGAMMLFTSGLDALGHREMEVERYTGEPNKLVGAVYNIAHYVLEKGPVLKEGEAVGLPDGAQMTVSFEASIVDPGMEVIRLAFD